MGSRTKLLPGWGATKPPPGSQIDWAHPLADGLLFCSPFNQGVGFSSDLVNPNRGPSTVGGGPGTWVPTPFGLGKGTCEFPASATADLALTSGAFSIWTRTVYQTALTSVSNLMQRWFFSSATTGWIWLVAYPSLHIQYCNGNGGGTLNADDTGVIPTLGNAYSLLSTSNGVNTRNIYVNGRLTNTSSSYINPVATSPAQPFFASADSRTPSLISAVWNRQLSIGEAEQLTAEPYCFFQPPLYRSYFLPPITQAGLSLSVPAGVASGDVLVAWVTANGSGSPTVTAPAGWSSFPFTTNNSGGTWYGAAVYWKVAGASEPPTYTWYFPSGFSTTGSMIKLTGLNSSGSFVDGCTMATGTGTAVATPAGNPTASGDEAVYFFSILDSGSAWSGLTRGATQASGVAAAPAYAIATETLTGTPTGVTATDAWGGSSVNWISAVLFLTPSGESPAPPPSPAFTPFYSPPPLGVVVKPPPKRGEVCFVSIADVSRPASMLAPIGQDIAAPVPKRPPGKPTTDLPLLAPIQTGGAEAVYPIHAPQPVPQRPKPPDRRGETLTILPPVVQPDPAPPVVSYDVSQFPRSAQDLRSRHGGSGPRGETTAPLILPSELVSIQYAWDCPVRIPYRPRRVYPNDLPPKDPVFQASTPDLPNIGAFLVFDCPPIARRIERPPQMPKESVLGHLVPFGEDATVAWLPSGQAGNPPPRIAPIGHEILITAILSDDVGPQMGWSVQPTISQRKTNEQPTQSLVGPIQPVAGSEDAIYGAWGQQQRPPSPQTRPGKQETTNWPGWSLTMDPGVGMAWDMPTQPAPLATHGAAAKLSVLPAPSPAAGSGDGGLPITSPTGDGTIGAWAQQQIVPAPRPRDRGKTSEPEDVSWIKANVIVIGGPYYVAAGGVFCPGAVIGGVWQGG